MTSESHIKTTQGLVSGLVGRSAHKISNNNKTLVALHGGTYTGTYFHVPGYSFIDKACAAGFNIVALDRPGYGATQPFEDVPFMLDRNAPKYQLCCPTFWLS